MVRAVHNPFFRWLLWWRSRHVPPHHSTQKVPVSSRVVLSWGLLTCSSQEWRGTGVLKLFRFGLDWSLAMVMGLLLMRLQVSRWSRQTKSGKLRLLCCSGGTVQSSSFKSWYLVPLEHLLSLLPLRIHPQAYGQLLHRSYGGSSRGRVTL